MGINIWVSDEDDSGTDCEQNETQRIHERTTDHSASIGLLITCSGYSIETYCHTRRFYAPEEREHRGFTLAKMKNYFFDAFAWTDVLNDAVDIVPAQNQGEDGEPIPFHLVAAASSEDGNLTLSPYKVDNMGWMPREAWYDDLARSKFMVGHNRTHKGDVWRARLLSVFGAATNHRLSLVSVPHWYHLHASLLQHKHHYEGRRRS
jgi:hypothetical protein